MTILERLIVEVFDILKAVFYGVVILISLGMIVSNKK